LPLLACRLDVAGIDDQLGAVLLITGIEAQEAEAVRARSSATEQANRNAADANAIRNTISQFQDAFNRKDLQQMQNIWTAKPTAGAEIYRTEFRDAKSLQFSLTPVAQPRVEGDTAAVICTRSQTFVPKNGLSHPPTSERVRVVLVLSGPQWLIRTILPLSNQ
jgi:ketosteroid isomerase-like protein